MKRHKVKFRRNRILILSILAICLISFTVSFGKYALDKINDFYLRTKEFYFYSDKLKKGGARYSIDNWNGVDPYNIVVEMNSKENNLLVSSYDIAYQINYYSSSNAMCQLESTSGAGYNVISVDNDNSDTFIIKVYPNGILNIGDVVNVHISAESNAEYYKKLEADFELIVGREDLTYKIEENDDFVLIKVTNTLSYYTNYGGGAPITGDEYLNLSPEQRSNYYSALVTISFLPSEFIMDTSDKEYQNAYNIGTTTYNGYSYVNSITFPMEAVSSANVRLFKYNTTSGISGISVTSR